MNEFDLKAKEWDVNPVHFLRSEAISKKILEKIPVDQKMTALDFGAGTGILGLMLADRFKSITLMDTSVEMVGIMNFKVEKGKFINVFPVCFDLLNQDYQEHKFDCIITQMVLHHIQDLGLILSRFYNMTSEGGYIAIADLYEEDGSFHGDGFDGHKGFKPELLAERLEKAGYKSVQFEECYSMKKDTSGGLKDFPVFLMTAIK
jgi:2-polyprenyl-3-methyl-5-hydroxy-6-metoxy-1,4-benzoquinol methylase